MPSIGVHGQSNWWGRIPPEDDYTFKALRCMHDYTNQFNMKYKKNQFGGRKVVGQATRVSNSACPFGIKSADKCPPCPVYYARQPTEPMAASLPRPAKSPFTQYNRLSNRLNVCIHDTTCCPTGY